MGRSLLAGLLVVLLSFSTLLAVCPSLHKLLHDDAAREGHQCAITMLQQQLLVPAAPAPLLLDVPLGFVASAPMINVALLSVAECWSFPSRAPPGFFVS